MDTGVYIFYFCDFHEDGCISDSSKSPDICYTGGKCVYRNVGAIYYDGKEVIEIEKVKTHYDSFKFNYYSQSIYSKLRKIDMYETFPFVSWFNKKLSQIQN